MNSGIVLAGTDGCTISTIGTLAMAATGAMSRTNSKFNLEYSAALIAFGAPTNSSVYPSGAARTTYSVAKFVPAPGRGSLTNSGPRRSVSGCDTRREMMSVVPPAVYPSTQRTGRDG